MISEERVEEIMSLHYRTVYNYCYSRLKNVADAQDVTQNVFALLIEKADELEESNIKSWLYEVAVRKLKETKREKIIHSRLLSYSETATELINRTDFIGDVELEYINEEEITEIRDKLLCGLNERELKLYKAVYEDCRGRAEIADELGISENALTARICRLKNKLTKNAKISLELLSFALVFMFF